MKNIPVEQIEQKKRKVTELYKTNMNNVHSEALSLFLSLYACEREIEIEGKKESERERDFKGKVKFSKV